MKKFEVGKKYYSRSIHDHECIYEIEVVSRTDKTITYMYDGFKRRSKIKVNERGEYVTPDNYSMAPVFRAERVVEITPTDATAATENDNTVITMIGQSVVGNFGAGFPNKDGIIIGFKNINSRFYGTYAAALILWEGKQLEVVSLSEIHKEGWRSVNGSPIGIFVK